MGKNRRKKAEETIKKRRKEKIEKEEKRNKKISKKEKKRENKTIDKEKKHEKRLREIERKRKKKASELAKRPSQETYEPVRRPTQIKYATTKKARKRRADRRKKRRGHECCDDVLSTMIETYKPDGTDWMGFKATPNNFYTFHHIKEKRFNGTRHVSNGAILTLRAHTFLNLLDVGCHSAYEDYQRIFRRINESHQPPDADLLEDIYGMMLDIFYYNTYHIRRDILDRFEKYTYKLK